MLGTAITEHLDNVSCEPVIDLAMSWHRLRNFRSGILVPVVFAAMANENTASTLEFSY